MNALYKVNISFLATCSQFLLTYHSFPLDYCFWLDTVHHLLIYLDKFHTGAVETHDQTTVGKISVEIFSTVVPTVRACSSRAVHILPFVCRLSYISKTPVERVLRMVKITVLKLKVIDQCQKLTLRVWYIINIDYNQCQQYRHIDFLP